MPRDLDGNHRSAATEYEISPTTINKNRVPGSFINTKSENPIASINTDFKG
jgi:hypothetical protein